MSSLFDAKEFEDLILDVQSCEACSNMNGCARVLSWANGRPGVKVMFVGEAPGRLGADRTAIPFHGDKSGDNFEKLIDLAGLARAEIFVTNAVLCNPRNNDGNNVPPTRDNIKKCAGYLARQISLVNPEVVVTLGSVALEASRLVEEHGLQLSAHVRTANEWYGRLLIPLYHPGARAMIHRNFALQTADYYFVGEVARRNRGRPNLRSAPVRRGWALTSYLLSQLGQCSLFRLHKALFLTDLGMLRTHGRRATDFVYIRQKDGPYCVELGSRWFDRFPGQLKVKKVAGTVRLEWVRAPLFQETPDIELDARELVDKVVAEICPLSDGELKTKVYLSSPMRAVLREERAGRGALNKPLL